MKLLLDNDLPPGLAATLRDQGYDVQALREVYGSGSKDTSWIPAAARDGFAIVSADKKQLTRPLERKALDDNGVRAAYFTAWFANLRLTEKEAVLVKLVPNLMEWAQTGQPSDLVTVAESGLLWPATRAR